MNAATGAPLFETAGMDEIRPCFEGLIPAVMATVAPDGTPNVAYLSQVYHVDDAHVALSFQFFNKTRRNLLAHPRSTVLLLHPYTGRFYRLHLSYLRTETQGPAFESMKAQLAGIASHCGMAEVFVLKGADIHQVLAIERLPSVPPPTAIPAPPPRRDGLLTLRRCSQRIAGASTLDALLDAALDALVAEADIRHAMVLIDDAATRRLYTVASRGYPTSGVGSEVEQGLGVIGVAARERTPVRINHLTTAQLYNQAIGQALDDQAAHDIPYPGLAAPRSQLAVPLIAGDRVVGVLFVESEEEMRFTYQDEDLLVAFGGQLAAAIELMREAEEPCTEAPGPQAVVDAGPPAPPLAIRRYRRDDSIFVNNAYLIKGVAGAILWKLLNDHRAGRREFTNRELRLDTSLGLPDVSDNLEARLLLLHRRLNEQCPALMLQKTGRGCFRFDALASVELDEVA